mgnify:FL=1
MRNAFIPPFWRCIRNNCGYEQVIGNPMTTGQYINFMADNDGQDNFGKAVFAILRKIKRAKFSHPQKTTEINSIFDN